MANGSGKGEKILVSVRVRPRNEKEKARNDFCDWECVNNTTIICNHNFPERSLFPSTYTFDRVFGFDCPTSQVYEDGAKEVALCVLEGINSSIFAYGQTSSGKTYTMCGITKFAMDDIFAYIQKHEEREFILKFSAIEIYNEAVRDLLREDNNQLRLLDDPERGTVVEKLTEATLRDRSHLEELISVCENQRKIGETSMNETSSRSHQILRLTIESSGREYSPENASTLAASVCFVDLAGSERASQTLSAGTRLKEGCHINRSLLTLGTVIRKLSIGKGGHIPYRDSKLTRILQNSLGGNARTAIICTMSPARSHVEQSRNTLLFANCAKEVATNAQVNLVVSEKALVKQLQQELARMENELKNLGSSTSAGGSNFYSLLKQKEEVIAKMEEQMNELKWQRDLAQSQVENLLKTAAEERSSRMDEHSMLSSVDSDAYHRRRSYDSTDIEESSITNSLTRRNFEFLENSEDEDFLLDDITPQFSRQNLYDGWEEMVQKIDTKLEDVCKEVACIETEGKQSNGETATVESNESLDDVVDKKAVSEVLSPRNEETLSTPESEQRYNSFTGNKKAENEDTEITMPAEKKNVELSLNAKPETYEPSLRTSDFEMSQPVEAQETQESVKEDKQIRKEESKMSTSTNPEKLTLKNLDLEMSPLVEAQETPDYAKDDGHMKKEERKTSPSTNQAELYLNAKPETYELTLKNSDLEMNPLVESQETKESAKEDEQMKKEEIKISRSTKQAEQSSNKEEKDQSEQSEETEEVRLIPDGVKLGEDVTSEEKQDNKLHQDTDRDYNESSVCKNIGTDDIDNNTYLALQEKIKEMQKQIEYLMHTSEQQQSPSFRRDYKSPIYFSRSQSCRDNLLTARSPLWFENLESSNDTSPAWRVSELKPSPGKSIRQAYNTSSISFDSGSASSSTPIYPRSLKDSDPDTGNSFHEFVAGLEEMVRQHSNDLTLELDNETSDTPTRTERIEIRPEIPAFANPQKIVEETRDINNDQSERKQDNDLVGAAVPKETYSMEACSEKQQVASGQYSSSDFERQQKQIFELWAVCNVPLVHRTYFFLLFKGDPSDYVYMEVELRRLSFLKQTISKDPETSRLQTVKTLIREKEWLSKKIPRKFTRSQRIELYRKWGVDVNSKQRSLQVAHKLWTNTQDIEHIKESASLVAKLLGFVEQSRMPKEMFGLSLLTGTEDIKPSSWRFTKSFSGIRLTGL